MTRLLRPVLSLILGWIAILAVSAALRGDMAAPTVAFAALGGLGLVLGAPAVGRLSPRAFVVLVVSITAVTRFLWIFLCRAQQVSDFAIYDELARALLHGQWYAITGPVGFEDLQLYLQPNLPVPYTTALRPPGAPFLAFALYSVFGVHQIVFKLANIALDAGTGLLLHRLLRDDRPVAARMAALLWALCPSSIVTAGLLATEPPFTFLMLSVAVLLQGRAGAARPFRTLMAIGVLMGAGFLFRTMIPVVAGSAMLALLQGDGAKRGIAAFAVVMACAALVVAPWSIRNTRLLGRFVPISTMESDVIGRHTLHLVPMVDRTPAWQARVTAWRSESEFEKSRAGYRFGRENVLAWIHGGPLHMLRAMNRAVASTFNSDGDMLNWATRRRAGVPVTADPRVFGVPVTADARVFSDGTRAWLAAATNGFYLAVVLAALGSLLRPETTRLLRAPGPLFLTALFALTFAVFSILSGQPRYHLPLMPSLLMLAVLSLPATAPRK